MPPKPCPFMANKSAPLQTVTALDPVRYDGIDHAPGEAFEVRPDDLAQLIEATAVSVTAPAA